jgi:hypothetical protein
MKSINPIKSRSELIIGPQLSLLSTPGWSNFGPKIVFLFDPSVNKSPGSVSENK